MDLAEYLFKNKITGRDFAKTVGYDYTYISAVKNGSKFPGRKMRERIYEATNGEVTFDSTREVKFKVKAKNPVNIATSEEKNETVKEWLQRFFPSNQISLQ